jgi:hypothetical protein
MQSWQGKPASVFYWPELGQWFGRDANGSHVAITEREAIERMAETTSARCYEHRDRDTLPSLCHTCQRIAVERDIVTRAIDALVLAGYQVRESEDGAFTDTRSVLLNLLFDLDDAFVIANHKESGKSGWVRFVFGNDGYDVISDYTISLESVLAPVNAYADTLAV